jgi:hypothetical protein
MAVQSLKPRVDMMKARYGDDKDKVQRETNILYQQAGVNPLAGAPSARAVRALRAPPAPAAGRRSHVQCAAAAAAALQARAPPCKKKKATRAAAPHRRHQASHAHTRATAHNTHAHRLPAVDRDHPHLHWAVPLADGGQQRGAV